MYFFSLYTLSLPDSFTNSTVCYEMLPGTLSVKDNTCQYVESTCSNILFHCPGSCSFRLTFPYSMVSMPASFLRAKRHAGKCHDGAASPTLLFIL